MNDMGGELTKYRVSKLANCSIGWTMEYLKQLEEKELIIKTKVIDPEGLLDHWFSILQKPIRYDFFVDSPTEFLLKTDMDYVLTTYKAENLLNHYLFPSRTDIYIKKEDFPRWKEKISEEGLVGKGNFRLLLYDGHVFYNKQNIDRMWVASIPQVLIDLRREGGVCKEAYEIMVNKYV